jgi:tetratricopeptide (TPR) repeat protein
MLQKPLIHLLLITVLGLLAYSGTFNVPFYLDDMPNIVENPGIKDLLAIPSMFTDISGPLASRPLALATFALNHSVGGLDTTLYHLVNLALHLINGTLLYLLVTMTAGLLGRKGDEIRLMAIFSSALFVLHPIQTESVTYIVTRSMLLATMFYLLGIMLFIRAAGVSPGGRGAVKYAVGLFIVSLMGVASREDFVTFPVMLLLYDYVFVSRRDIRGLLRNWWLHLPGVLALGYLAFLVAGYEYVNAGPEVKNATPLQYLMTQFNVHRTYLRLLLLPLNQNLDYGYPVAETMVELPTAVSFLGYLGLWGAVVYSVKKRPAVAFPLLWFLVTLMPASSVVPLVDVIFEHRLYLPSVGAFTLIAACVAALKKKRTALNVFAVVVLLFSSLTYARNALWQDEIRFWEDVAEKSPAKPRPHNNLGVLYEGEGRYEDAIREYRAALDLDPFYTKSHVNLGILFMNQGRHEEALKEFLTSTRIAKHLEDMNIPAYTLHAHYNLGVVYARLGRYDEAEEEFIAVLGIDPEHAEARNNLGVVYEKKERFKDAVREYRETLRLNPDFAEAHFNLGVVYGKLEMYDRAVEAYQAAFKVDPGYAEAHNNLGSLYIKRGRYEDAVGEFQAALTIDPENDIYIGNLSYVYGLMEGSEGFPVNQE